MFSVTAQAKPVGSVSDVGSLRGIWECMGSQKSLAADSLYPLRYVPMQRKTRSTGINRSDRMDRNKSLSQTSQFEEKIF